MAESLLRTQNDLSTRILKGKANFKKSPKERLTFSYLESRLENLELQWKSFVNTHQKIVSLMKPEDYLKTDYAENDVYDEVEDEYLNYKTLLKEGMTSMKVNVGNNEQLRNTTESRQVFVKLPEIALPKFSGNYAEWANYKDLFTSLIHNNCSLEDVQRLHYLKSSLTGEAENLVKFISVTADNYKVCWDRLVNRYDNKKAMANSIIKRLMTQKPLLQESTSAIRLLLDTTNECLQSLGNMGVNVESWDLILIYIISQKLDPESRAKWETKLGEGKDELPKFKMLEEFLETRFRSLEYKLSDRSHTNDISKSLQATTNKEFSCLFCSDKHKLTHCKKFIEESVDIRRQFVQTQHLCFNCLSPEHSVYRCNTSTTCRTCKKRHHTLLHPEPPISVGKSRQHFEKGKVVAVVTEAASTSREHESEFVDSPESDMLLTSCFSKSHRTALLATALVKAKAQTNSGSPITMRCLLDQGSEASFITESAVQLLGLKKCSDSVRISGLGGPTSVHSKASVKIKLDSLNNPQFSMDVRAHVLDKLTNLLPSQKVPIDHSQMKTFLQLKLADPRFNRPSGIDMLLGTEVYSKILMEGLIHSADGNLIAQNTKFGWVLSGSIGDSVTGKNHRYSYHTLPFNEVDDSLLKRFWELEAEPVLPDKILTNEEKACEELFTSTTRRDEQGRYVVRLPFNKKDPASKYGGSKTVARRRFLSLEKRLLGDPVLQAEYSKVMKEYISMGHMELCTDKNAQEAVYLPHHAVIREDKDTTKVRVVFDASCKGWNGASLNGDLMIGPRLQPELRHLVMRWRRYPISLVADIVKMYRQVRVATEDVNFQRIFWRDNPYDEIRHYRLLRVTFGTSSAPYLATRALQQTAHDEGTAFPDAKTRVITDFYVDDLMTGCHSVAEGIQVYKQMTELLNQGGFPLQKWSSNNKVLQDIIGKENDVTTSSQPLELKTDEIMKILGLTWNKEADNFRIRVNLPPSVDTPVTKRKVISEIAKLFDPLGWLSPTIIKAKVFIQTLWLAGIGWDDDLPSGLLAEWLCFRKDLPKLEAFSIPRWIHSNNDDQLLELHGFSDASNAAYAAVVYARIVDNANNIHVHLLTAKTRVAPVKQISIPRLELCGANLLAKLLNEVGNVLNIHKQNIHAWSDSTIVLAWLRSHPSRWKTFVANRVSEILSILDGNQWSHISSEDNPADCASRGLEPTELIGNHLWMHGPKYLHNFRVEYNNTYEKDSHLEEKKPKLKSYVTATNVSNTGEELILRFSSLQRLIRVISFCRRVLHWRKSEHENIVNRSNKGLTLGEINDSLFACIKMCQNTHLQGEIENLQLNGQVNKKSKLISLNPFLDDNNILRVGGRLHNSSLDENVKHPVIIPHKSHLTKLLIDDAHRRTLHGGPQLVLNFLQAKYWIIGAKGLVRQHVHKCTTCIRHSRQTNQQMMGRLPLARVTAQRPFCKTGLDYAGPISVRRTGGRGNHSTKGYICIFVCMAIRAVHLEVVSDLTSDSFLAAFKRFVARRGHVAEIWSDNGTTFVGAAKKLTELLEAERSTAVDEISDWLASNGTAWHFIPPYSPNFGGLWEAAVKSTKFHLARVIGTHTLTFEEMTTTLAQIEACLNSRPMSQLSSDANDPCPLTPGHFLVGEPLVLVPECNYETSNISSLRRWHLIQRMTQDFWRRWSEEYLTRLQHRYKWTNCISEPKIGDVVLVKEAGLPPAHWLYGLIVESHPGQDGLTRVVSLKCRGKLIKRPVSKLIILPKSD